MPIIYKCPYKGLAPYTTEDAKYFFGRDEERRVISDNLRASRLTLLYGESGVGKSSVLNAGVTPQLREDRDYSVVVFPQPGGGRDSWRDDPIESLRRVIGENLSLCLPAQESTQPQPSDLTALVRQFGTLLNRTLLVILDQFEEYFQYHPKEVGEGTLADELPRLLYGERVPVNFLIAIREDELASLDRFKRTIPNMFDNYLRVGYLTQAGAREAILKPVETYSKEVKRAQAMFHSIFNSVGANQPYRGLKVSTALAMKDPLSQDPRTRDLKTLLGSIFNDDSLSLYDLLAEPIELPVDLAGDVMNQIIDVQADNKERVQTPYLQLVMTSWWEHEVKSGSRLMQIKTLNEDLGGVKKIVDSYLEATINALPADEREAAAAMFEFMVTSAGRKHALSVSELTESVMWYHIDRTTVENVLKKLHQARIISSVPPLGQLSEGCYEFAHDVVAKAARDWRQKHTLVHRAEEAKQEATRAGLEAAEARREAAQALAEARQAKLEKEQAKLEAEQARQETTLARQKTEKVFLEAEQAMREAEGKILAAKHETERAELAILRADGAEKEAAARTLEAESAKRVAQEARSDAELARREERRARRMVNNTVVIVTGIILAVILLAILWKVAPPQPHLTIEPSTVTFPDTLAGTATGNVSTVIFFNPGKASTYITNFIIAPEDSQKASLHEVDFFLGASTCNLPGPLAPGAGCAIQVRFMPASPGIKSAKLNVLSNAGTRFVTLSGRALAGIAK
jgi:hypothetical protein